MQNKRKISPDNFDARARHIYGFVAHWHRDFKRKYSKEPYINHLAAVANTVWDYTGDSTLVAVALCHDLYEDTDCSERELFEALAEAGYSQKEASMINQLVWELTDKFVTSKYPGLNRRKRMEKEIERLGTISADAQTVKYADILDNQPDIARHDPHFSLIFTREAKAKLAVMDKGLPELFKLVKEVVNR